MSTYTWKRDRYGARHALTRLASSRLVKLTADRAIMPPGGGPDRYEWYADEAATPFGRWADRRAKTFETLAEAMAEAEQWASHPGAFHHIEYR